MTFQESLRCPTCLGQDFYKQYGDYVCYKCDITYSYSFLCSFIDAFEKGRRFQLEKEDESKSNMQPRK